MRKVIEWVLPMELLMQVIQIRRNSKPSELKCQASNKVVTFDQFQYVDREYLKLNKNTKKNKIKTKKSNDRVSTQMRLT